MRRLCAECGEREPKFSVRGGRIKTDDDHTLCQQCYRALKNRERLSSEDACAPVSATRQPRS